MKTGQCPKCGSGDVRTGAGIREKEKIALHTGEGIFGSLPKLNQYVCVSCGYIETYLEDAAGLSSVAQHWPPVKPN